MKIPFVILKLFKIIEIMITKLYNIYKKLLQHLIQYICSYPYKQKLKLSHLRKIKYESHLKYKIWDHNDLDISISIIFLYVMIFIILLFISKLRNINKNPYFSQYLELIHIYFEKTHYCHLIINILLIISIFLFYILFIKTFIKYIKHHVFKLYYFLFRFSSINSEYQIMRLQDNITIYHYTKLFERKYLFKNPKNKLRVSFDRFIFIHLESLQFMIHRIILVLVIIYDLKYNNMILSHMFKILPYIFAYELWVKISIFLKGINTAFDNIVVKLLYGQIIQMEDDNECLYLDGEPYEKKILKKILTDYVQNGFVDKYYLPEDPFKESIKDLIKFWKHITIIPFIKKLSQYKIIDIIYSIILIIYLLEICIIKIIT